MRLTVVTLLAAICGLFTQEARGQIVPLTNNECFNSIALGVGVNPGGPAGLSGHVFTNVGATPGAPIVGPCSQPLNDVWFSYTASVAGTTTISTCTPAGFAPGSLVDTFMSIQNGVCMSQSIVACGNDDCGTLSSATFSAVIGQTYMVRIGGISFSTGTFYVVVTPPPPPSNDDCSGAIALAYGANGSFSNFTATDSGAAASCAKLGSPGYRDLWFSLLACGTLTIDTCGSFDTILQVYDACGGVELACDDDAGCGSTSSVTLTLPIGTNCVIRVSAWDPLQAGSFPINVTSSTGFAPSLTWSSPSGPGSLKAELSGPQGGTYFMAVTGTPGTFPNGWLFGLDISYAELATELATGFPFAGPLGACGIFTLGPFNGLPPGLTIYSLVFGFPPGSSVPSAHSTAMAYTIP